MAAYTRQSSFSDGDTISASLFNNEYDALAAAFVNTSGHKHDGTTGEGPVIGLIGDASVAVPLNKILVDSTANHLEFYVDVSSSAVQQLYIADGLIAPVTDSDVDLGTSSLYFKNAYIDAITTTGNVSVGGNLTVTGTTTFNGGTLTLGDADTDNIVFGGEVDSDIIPDDDGTYDLGSSSKEWQDLFIDGTANIDSLVADTADINGGTIDGAVIGGASAAAITGTSLTLSSNADFNGDLDVDGTTNLDNTDIDGTLVVDGSNISLDSTSTLNIDNSNTSNGITIGTATSGVPISIGHSTSETTVNDNLTVTGDLTVSGTTTTVSSTTVAIADSLLKLAKDQGTSADAVDFGFYGQYGVGGTAKYAGVFRDQSTSGDPFTFFDDLQAEPGTTVNTGGTGYDLADIAAGGATFADDVVITGDLTVSGDDITMGTNTAGHVMVADGSNFNPVAISGDVTIASSGAVTIASGAVETAMVNANIVSGQTAITSSDVDSSNDTLLLHDNNASALKKVTVASIISSAGGLTDVVADTTPQLGGNLDTNSHNILIDDAHFIGDESGNEQIIFQTTASAVNQFDITNAATSNAPSISATGDDTNISMSLLPKGSGVVLLDGNGSSGGVSVSDGLIDIRTGTGSVAKVKFYCESSNAHAQTLQAAPHSAGSSAVLVLPTASGNLIGTGDSGTVTNTMLSGSIADSKLSTISTAGKVELGALEIDGASEMGAALADADLLIVDDGAGGTEKSMLASRIPTYVFSKVSGDATVASNGALTIAAQAVENSMLADDAVGADELAANAVVNASIASGAAIAFSKMANLTVSRALVSDGSGDVSAATTTSTEIGYVNGVTSAIQTQLDAKATAGFAVAMAIAL